MRRVVNWDRLPIPWEGERPVPMTYVLVRDFHNKQDEVGIKGTEKVYIGIGTPEWVMDQGFEVNGDGRKMFFPLIEEIQ